MYRLMRLWPAATLALAAVALWSIEAWARNTDNPQSIPGWNVGLGPLVSSLMLIAIILFAPPTAQSFIYFQF